MARRRGTGSCKALIRFYIVVIEHKLVTRRVVAGRIGLPSPNGSCARSGKRNSRTAEVPGAKLISAIVRGALGYVNCTCLGLVLLAVLLHWHM